VHVGHYPPSGSTCSERASIAMARRRCENGEVQAISHSCAR
jgi:hypothetical protein